MHEGFMFTSESLKIMLISVSLPLNDISAIASECRLCVNLHVMQACVKHCTVYLLESEVFSPVVSGSTANKTVLLSPTIFQAPTVK